MVGWGKGAFRERVGWEDHKVILDGYGRGLLYRQRVNGQKRERTATQSKAQRLGIV